MSQFINGDRFVYVSSDVTPPLPKETVIAGHPCRIWHPSQKNFCKRCASHGHRTVDVDICESHEADCVVAASRADRNPLRNYYMSNITHADMNYTSVEHYYQSEFCHHCGRDDVAQQVYGVPTPRQAKEIATKLKYEVHIDYMASWTKIKVSIMEMERALKLKWNCCSKYRQALMSTESMVIAEATQDDFWGVGVAPNLAEHTKPSKVLGLNQLGRLHMKIRDIVSEREPQNCNSDFDVPSTHLISTTPHELSITDFSTTEHIICQTRPFNGETTSPPASESLERINSSVSTPNRPPRKKVKRSDTRSTGKNVNTLDNYVKKDTPTSMRRLSRDTISPSSMQVAKTTRTDEGDGGS